jgi:ADP-ribose pyrophosphatase YjhB (NUDIX family)
LDKKGQAMKYQPSHSRPPAEQIALWADTLRDVSAEGLQFASSVYDHDRYQKVQDIALAMMALITSETIEELEIFRETYFSRRTPIVSGAAAVIRSDGAILLMRRSDSHQWSMPAGGMEVGETPAAAVVRETVEETGVRCQPVALVGVYDSMVWGNQHPSHEYKFTFLCVPCDEGAIPDTVKHSHEALSVAWFDESHLPPDLHGDHAVRARDAYRVWHGDLRSYFDK